MTQKLQMPISLIASCHPVLHEVAATTAEEWLPEEIPVTVGLAALGRALVNAEPSIDDATLNQISGHVEDLLETGDRTADAVATGFLEAIVHQSASSEASVKRIVQRFGARAVAYLEAWDTFTGVDTPGIS